METNELLLQILGKLDSLESGQAELKQGQTRLEIKVDKMQTDIDQIKEQVDIVYDWVDGIDLKVHRLSDVVHNTTAK